MVPHITKPKAVWTGVVDDREYTKHHYSEVIISMSSDLFSS